MRGAKIGLYDIAKSTTLESNKSHFQGNPTSCLHWVVYLYAADNSIGPRIG